MKSHKYARTNVSRQRPGNIFTRHSTYLLLYIPLLIYWPVSASEVAVILGRDNTLSCPVNFSGSVGARSVMEWFRGTVSNSSAMLARLVTVGVYVEYNYTAFEKILINLSGDLIIQNLTMGDVGFYTCHFTGSKAQIIQTYVRGVFYWVFVRYSMD